jgi:hypothetical protein
LFLTRGHNLSRLDSSRIVWPLNWPIQASQEMPHIVASQQSIWSYLGEQFSATILPLVNWWDPVWKFSNRKRFDLSGNDLVSGRNLALFVNIDDGINIFNCWKYKKLTLYWYRCCYMMK